MSHYNLLGISRNANQGEILRAYRKKALEVHPDKNLGDKRCEELFKKLTKAKEDLLDPNKRDGYDGIFDAKEDESDVSVNLDAMPLPNGRRISEEFTIKIGKWRTEYENIALVDNFHIMASSPVRIADALLRIPDELPDDVLSTQLAYQMRLTGDLTEALREALPDDVWNVKSSSELSAVELAAKAKELARSKDYENALHYFRVLLDEKGHEAEATLGLLNALMDSQNAEVNVDGIKKAVFAAAQQYSDEAEFHKLALNILMEEDDLKASSACIKTILLLDTRDSSIPFKRNILEARLEENHYSGLKELLYAYCDQEKRETGQCLLKMAEYMNGEECHSAAKKLHAELVKDRDISQLNGPFKAALCILNGYCQMEAGSYLAAEQDLVNAILSYPDEEVYETVSRLMSKRNIQGVSRAIGAQLSQPIGERLQAHKYMDKLKPNPNFKAVFRYEKSVENSQEMSNLDKAMAHLDLGMAAIDSSMLCVTFINAASYFVQEMTTLSAAGETCDIGQLYALRNAVSDLCMSGVVCARKFEQPVTELHLLKQFLVLFHTANRILSEAVSSGEDSSRAEKKEPVNIVRNVHTVFDTMMATSIERLAKVTPFVNLPLVLSGDMVYVDIVSSAFTMAFYEAKLRDNADDYPWNYLYHYQLLEGCWKSGAHSGNSFQKYRYIAMAALLKRKSLPNWTLEQIEATMNWPTLRRNDRGFLDRGNTNLQLTGPNYDFVQGVHIILENGVPTHFQLELVQSSEGLDGLFDDSDIAEILQNGIMATFFTLNQAEFDLDCHPFQEMKFFPEKLEGTNYLQTMLHADYLLKMLSVGCEVSSRIPFEFQDTSGPGGFVATLPETLQTVVMAPGARKDGPKSGSAHRFWIDAGTIPFVASQTEDMISYEFGYCPMKVKTHLLKRSADGELVDDDTDKDEDVTPERESARDLTAHYDEIGDQFPVLLRLRELHKLAAVYLLLKSAAVDLKERTENFNVSAAKTAVIGALNNLRSQVSYPTNTSATVDVRFRQVLRDNAVEEASQVLDSEVVRLKTIIRSQLQQADNHSISQLCKFIENEYQIPAEAKARLEDLIKMWMDNGRMDDLVNLITETVVQETTAKLSQFANYSASLGISYENDDNNETGKDSNRCTWVPSAFHSNSPYRCYGGVRMNVSLESVVVTGNRLDKRSKSYVGPGDLYTIQVLYRGFLFNIWKRGVSMQDKYHWETGNPLRAERQLRLLQKGFDPNCPYRPEDGFSFRVKYKTFDFIARWRLEDWEAAQKINDITKDNRTNLGDNDYAAKQARDAQMWSTTEIVEVNQQLENSFSFTSKLTEKFPGPRYRFLVFLPAC